MVMGEIIVSRKGGKCAKGKEAVLGTLFSSRQEVLVPSV
jgi:hypothetical protein